MEETKMVCIGCPQGCEINIFHEKKSIKSINGYRCTSGLQYAENEFTEPKRILTSTVKVNFGELPCVPVKTKNPIHKDKIFACMRELEQLEVSSPIKLGTIITRNIGQTGVDLIAAKTVNRISSQRERAADVRNLGPR